MAKFNLTKLTAKAKDLVDKKGDKIAAGVDKVTDKIDQKTKGKYHDKLEKVDSAAAKLDKTDKSAGDDEVVGEAAATGPAPADPAEAVAATEDTTPDATPPAATPPSTAAADFPEPS